MFYNINKSTTSGKSVVDGFYFNCSFYERKSSAKPQTP
jgi:hypothetical protein